MIKIEFSKKKKSLLDTGSREADISRIDGRLKCKFLSS
jgi:hypothetical protein